MIPEPPDGTIIVVVPKTPNDMPQTFIRRDDRATTKYEKCGWVGPAHRWFRYGESITRWEWDHVVRAFDVMYTLHLVGPELKEKPRAFQATTHVPDAPGYSGNDPNKWYLALCHDCDGYPVPFALAEARADYWTIHTEATGHRVTCHDIASANESTP